MATLCFYYVQMCLHSVESFWRKMSPGMEKAALMCVKCVIFFIPIIEMELDEICGERTGTTWDGKLPTNQPFVAFGYHRFSVVIAGF